MKDPIWWTMFIICILIFFGIWRLRHSDTVADQKEQTRRERRAEKLAPRHSAKRAKS